MLANPLRDSSVSLLPEAVASDHKGCTEVCRVWLHASLRGEISYATKQRNLR